MSERVSGPGVRPGTRAGCLAGGLGRPWVLVAAMLAPAVLGGGLLAVSLAGVGARGREAGAARADVGVMSVEPRVRFSVSRPDVVYGRVVAKKARRPGAKRGRDAGGSRRVLERAARDTQTPGGDARTRLRDGVRERPAWRGEGKAQKKRPGAVECPPEKGRERVQVREEADRRVTAGEEAQGRTEGHEGVERRHEAVSELRLGIVTTAAE